MERNVKNILVLFMAAMIFFIGTGITVVDICCSNCFDIFFSSLQENTHISLHNKTEKNTCCSSTISDDDSTRSCTSDHEGNCCEPERISIDIVENRTFNPNISTSLLALAEHCHCCCYCHTSDIQIGQKYVEYTDTEPIPPREYLSLIRILII